MKLFELKKLELNKQLTLKDILSKLKHELKNE